MRRWGMLFLGIAAITVVVLVVDWRTPYERWNRAPHIPPDDRYDVRILRDNWGMPHIFGATDADCAYGLAYAHCEDDWVFMQDAVLTARAQLAAVHGQTWAPFDYLVQLFLVREFVAEKYETALSPEVRAIAEAYADGINRFAAEFPRRMPDITLPVTGQDIVVGAAFKSPFFYDLHIALEQMFAGDGPLITNEGVQASSPSRNPLGKGHQIGSNALAVAPHRSADGLTRMAINTHMPWEGQVTWYEAHLVSEEGWNVTGGTFPGGPMIFVGFDDNKGWCHTINRPDLADIYELEVNPDNPNQYRFEGEWHDFERDFARITVKLWGPIRWTVRRELLWSVHGPAVRHEEGAYAIAFAGYGEIGQLEQWYRMNRAESLDAFVEAMRTHQLPSFNTAYADRHGNLFYVYNGRFPVRSPAYDWSSLLPGNDPGALHAGVVPFDELPSVLNPASGFLQTCNSSPFYATNGPDNPREEDFPAWMGIETHLTNRSMRALELFSADPSITREAFYAYKFDKAYSVDSKLVSSLAPVLALAFQDDEPLLREAQALLRTWDRGGDKDNPVTALAILAGEPDKVEWEKLGGPPEERLRQAVDHLMTHFGRLDPPWEEVVRMRRGGLDQGLGGCPDCLRAIDLQMQPDGRFVGVNGDCHIMMVEWDSDGIAFAETIHQYGAMVSDETSPHFLDQAPLFANEAFRPVLRTEAAIREHLAEDYRPGERSR